MHPVKSILLDKYIPKFKKKQIGNDSRCCNTYASHIYNKFTDVLISITNQRNTKKNVFKFICI